MMFFLWSTRKPALLLPSTLLLICRTQPPLALRDRQQRRIKLHERCIHRRMLRMAAIAFHVCRHHLGRLRIAKDKEGPLAGEAGLVLHMRLQPHYFGALIIAFLVDRPLSFGATPFENQYSLVRPRSRF